jgi:hypothetical protein
MGGLGLFKTTSIYWCTLSPSITDLSGIIYTDSMLIFEQPCVS